MWWHPDVYQEIAVAKKKSKNKTEYTGSKSSRFYHICGGVEAAVVFFSFHSQRRSLFTLKIVKMVRN